MFRLGQIDCAGFLRAIGEIPRSSPNNRHLVLADCDLRRPCSCVLPRVWQETIAEMVGTTRSRVNVFMGKFKKLGFIEEGDGKLLVKPSLMQLVYAQ